MATVEIVEAGTKVIPLRLKCFNREFIEEWDKLAVGEKEVYLLGWLVKLDRTTQQLEERLNALEEKTDERNPD